MVQKILLEFIRKGRPVKFRYRLGFILFVLCWVSVNAVAQVTLKGTILDDNSKLSVIGGTIKPKGQQGGAITDEKGNFQITVKALPVTLLISSVGYKNQEIDVYEAEPVQVFLREDINKLAEVVVTGVAEGTTRKKLSFALTKVDNAQLNTVPSTDASTSLRGKVAGLRVDQSDGSQSGTVYLRGAKSISGNVAPLLVVDGFVTSLSLGDLNPSDIESIEVVKGAAAAALYGTRGEGGIIQVLTKKGKDKGRIDITVDNDFGISNVQRVPPTSQYHHFKVNSDGSFALSSGARTTDYQSNGYSVNLHPYQTSYDNVNNLLGDKPYLNNSVSLATAGDKYTLFSSFQNQIKSGVVEPVGADKRKNFLLNLGYKPNSKIETEITVQYSDANTPSSVLSGSSNGVLYAALLLEPFINLGQKTSDGGYSYKPDGFALQNFSVANPLYELSTRKYNYDTENILLGGKFKYKITPEVSAEVSGSIQNKYYNTENYYPIGYQTVSPDVTLNNGSYTLSTAKTATRNLQVQLNYNKKIKDFDLGAALKGVYEGAQTTGFSASGYNLTAPVKSLDVTEAATRTISSNWEKTINYGYFLNLKAGWKDKLFIDVLGRLDNSSRFGSNVATAFFPRASLAYRLTEDVKLGPVSELKLRAAYGQAGSLPAFGAKDSKVTITSSGGVSYTQNENTDLQRAVTEETELGFDAVLFNKLNVQFNYAFANSRQDFIQVPSFAPTDGSATIYDNLGKVRSDSYELEVSGRIIDKKKFSWDTGVTFSRVRSKITSLGGVPEFTDGDYRRAVGSSTTAIWGYSVFRNLSQLATNSQGYVTNAGDGTTKVSDYTVNKLGFVVLKSALGTASEAPVLYVNAATGNQKIIGDATPDFNVGFTNTFSYGPFSLYAVIDWQQGGKKYNETVQYLTYQYRSKFSDQVASAGLPLSFATAVFNGQLATDYWVEDCGYVALRELSLSYKLPVKRLGINKVLKNAKVALIGRNLYTWTKFTGVNVDGLGSSSTRSSDFFPNPTYRIVSAKLTLNF
ncbi:MAG: SusC/RagA family TonB-linked outer membrane protein [Bacteroidota bacterium]|nr:SusC/RagA family TonB-linked outer membrane protein [Bacteroidota bacterium]